MDLSTIFGQKASMYHDPNSVNHNEGGNEFIGYQQQDSDTNSSPSPSHSGKFKTESSVLLTSSKSSPSLGNGSASVSRDFISKEEKALIDFGGASIGKNNQKTNKSPNWETGWDDEAWSQLNIDVPKSKTGSRKK